jgi:hypothetical protein
LSKFFLYTFDSRLAWSIWLVILHLYVDFSTDWTTKSSSILHEKCSDIEKHNQSNINLNILEYA